MTGSRYWLAEPGGQPHGPYDLDALHAMRARGAITPSTQACPEGATSWVAASTLLGDAPSAAPPPLPAAPPGRGPADPYGSRGSGTWVPASYVGPVLVTIFCCLIGGIVSLVYTANANTKAAAGDFLGAERDKKTATTWMLVSLVGPLLLGMLWVALGVLTGGF